MELGSSFLFLQEEIKDIFIITAKIEFKLELNSHGACIHANPYYEPNMLNPNTRLFIIIIPFAKPYAGGVSRSLWRPAAACSRSTSVGFYSAHTNTLVSSSTCCKLPSPPPTLRPPSYKRKHKRKAMTATGAPQRMHPPP